MTENVIMETQKIGTPEKSTILRRFCPPTLERKDSSGDLQSRLKTRKILGVGETDNGDIHRSKISQVLGHNEHLYLKLPKGYFFWHLFLIFYLSSTSLLIIFFPLPSQQFGLLGPLTVKNSQNNEVNELNHQNENNEDFVIPARYFGAASLGFSFVLWKFLYLNDRTVTRVAQYGTAIFLSLQLSFDLTHIFTHGIGTLFQNFVFMVILVRVGIIFTCSFFWRKIGSATSGLRKSPSHKEAEESSFK